MPDKELKPIVPIMEHLNIAEFNRGQSSKLLRELVEADKTAYILKNGKPMAVVMSYERYQRLCKEGIDINGY
jgi:prevent-host-death family protein